MVASSPPEHLIRLPSAVSCGDWRAAPNPGHFSLSCLLASLNAENLFPDDVGYHSFWLYLLLPEEYRPFLPVSGLSGVRHVPLKHDLAVWPRSRPQPFESVPP